MRIFSTIARWFVQIDAKEGVNRIAELSKKETSQPPAPPPPPSPAPLKEITKYVDESAIAASQAEIQRLKHELDNYAKELRRLRDENLGLQEIFNGILALRLRERTSYGISTTLWIPLPVVNMLRKASSSVRELFLREVARRLLSRQLLGLPDKRTERMIFDKKK